MAEFQLNSISFSSLSSGGSRDSTAGGGDAENYEEIEAPKFVDFNSLDRYLPDDRYWFCLRVGCDQKHDNEMDSEAIYKKFVLRVMAARSPCMKLQKALEKKVSKTPSKCSLSAPPKSCKPTLSSVAKISSVSKKLVYEQENEDPASKLESTTTPKNRKTKPVSAKCLSSPRNTNFFPAVKNSFRTVQAPKRTTTAEVPRSREVSKALFPKRAEIVGMKISTNSSTSDEAKSGTAAGCNKRKILVSKKENVNNTKEKGNVTRFVPSENATDGDDDKENNATASETNRSIQLQHSGTKIQYESGGRLEKAAVVKGAKFTKQKTTTNPKPFRLRTDERKILKEAATTNSDRRACDDTDIFSPQAPEIQQKEGSIRFEETKRQTKSPRPTSSAMQRLEKFKKTLKSSSPLERQHNTTRPKQRPVSAKNTTCYMTPPGRKLDTIHENIPQVWQRSKPGKIDSRIYSEPLMQEKGKAGHSKSE